MRGSGLQPAGRMRSWEVGVGVERQPLVGLAAWRVLEEGTRLRARVVCHHWGPGQGPRARARVIRLAANRLSSLLRQSCLPCRSTCTTRLRSSARRRSSTQRPHADCPKREGRRSGAGSLLCWLRCCRSTTAHGVNAGVCWFVLGFIVHVTQAGSAAVDDSRSLHLWAEANFALKCVTCLLEWIGGIM